MTTAESPYGRVDKDGTVYVFTPEGERPVGSWHAGPPQEGLEYYSRRYEDVSAEISLLEARASADPLRSAATAERLRGLLPQAMVVGDLEALDRRLAAITEMAEAKRAEVAAEKAEQRAQAQAAKEELVGEAEQLTESSDWRVTDEKLRELVERWKTLPRLDRKTDDELWGRLATARSTFQRRRRAHFAELDERRKAARTRKEELVAEAEKLATSTEWGPTSNRFRDLMTEWKAAGGAPKGVEEQLWGRFKAAQDAFFAARTAARTEREAGLKANIAVKEELLAEAEKIDPTKDVAGARRRLRDIQRRWEAAGHVPREVAPALERRLAAVEEKVRGAAEARFRPVESPLVTQLRESIEKLERRLDRARAGGDDKLAAETQAALATQREWLAQATRRR